MSIEDLMIDPGPSIYYDDGFRAVLESYIPHFRTRSDTRELVLEAHKVYKYEFDFFGLLAEYSIPAHLHWIIMRLNNLTGPTDGVTKLASLKIPSETFCEQIRQIHMTMMRTQKKA